MPAQYSEPAMVACRPVDSPLRALGSRLLRGLGSRCRLCARWQAEVLCADCRAAFVPTCPPQGEAGGLPVRAALDYAPPWSGLIADFKYGQACELAGPLAALLAQALQPGLVSGAIARPDWIVPVPLSAARLRERGYNQAWELARRLAPPLGLRARADLVERLIDTPHQVGLDRQARERNLRGAFAVTPAGGPVLAGRSVALVDDVCTTGATVAALAEALRRAGAGDLQVWVVARTDRR